MVENMDNDYGKLLYDVTEDEDFIKQRNEIRSKKIKNLLRMGYVSIFALFLGVFMAFDITFFEIIFSTNNGEYKQGLATSIALIISGADSVFPNISVSVDTSARSISGNALWIRRMSSNPLVISVSTFSSRLTRM